MPSDADNAWNEMLGGKPGQASATSHQASAEGREASATSHQASGEGKRAAASASPLAAAAKWGAVALLGLIAITALTWVILSNRARPAITPAPPPSAGAPTAPSSPAPTTTQLDLNTATAAQLEQLPGIGPSLAARIIADRDTHGRYTTIDQLDRVSGIGKKTIDRLRPYLTVK